MSNGTEKRTETHACDCISRQAAITAIQKAYADTEGGTDKCAVWKNVGLTNALHIMQDLPSARSASYRQVTGKLDCISRQAAIDAWRADFKGYVDSLDLLRDDYNGIMEYIDETPSAQPDLDEWCADCKEYDQDRHCCPRWNKVIRETLKDAQPGRKTGKWIERNPQNSDKCRLIECDQCGFARIVGFNVPYEDWVENRNYCERCGADMRGEA